MNIIFFRTLIIVALLLISGLQISADEVLIDRPPNAIMGDIPHDQDYPDFPDFSIFVVASVSFDTDVELTSITGYFTDNNVWPANEFAPVVLNVFEGELGSVDDPRLGYIVDAFFVVGDDGMEVTADLAVLSNPLVLKGGTQYWIGITPMLEFNDFGSEFHQESDLGPNSMIRNPGGGWGFGTEWWDVGELTGLFDYSAAITITGNVLKTTQQTADSFNAFRGIYVSGDLDDTFESDNSYLKYRPGITLFTTEPPVWLVFDGTLPIDSPVSLHVTLEASSNTVNLTQTIEMFNWNSGQFETVDTTELAGFDSDTVYSINVSSDVANYVQPGSGAVRSRFGWRAGGPVFIYPWIVSIDQVEWSFGVPGG